MQGARANDHRIHIVGSCANHQELAVRWVRAEQLDHEQVLIDCASTEPYNVTPFTCLEAEMWCSVHAPSS